MVKETELSRLPNAISWPVRSRSLRIWNAWSWHHPKAKSGHGFEGKGSILWKLRKIQWTDRTQYYWYNQTFYKITLNVTKISILLLYLRIFPQKWLRIGCYLILALVITYGLISVFYSSVFQCNPVSKAYRKSIPGHCIDVRKTWQANAGFNIASDLMILVLPMPAIHSLQMSSKPKLGLIFLFGLGSLWVYQVNEKESFFLTFASVLVVSCLRASLLNAAIDPDLTCTFLPTPALSVFLNPAAENLL